MKQAIILFSGGLDSTTCLAIAQSQGYRCHALSFAYGQRHHIEIDHAKTLAKKMQAYAHHVIHLDTNAFAGSALTNQAANIPTFKERQEIPVTYVPARNTVFLAYALAFAETVGASAIFIGVSAVDYSGYPDCRPAYIDAFQQLANLAIAKPPIHLQAPLIHLSKAETIQLGLSLGVDYCHTVSCYQANAAGEACGQCDSCGFRQRGFRDAGVQDPTRYA